jgi:hypothetical protein
MNSFNCLSCPKVFKRQQDLKTHITKFHSQEVTISTIARASTYDDTIPQICEDINEPMTLAMPNDLAISFNLLSEPETESIFNMS